MIWVNSTPHTAGPEAPGVAVSISSRRRWGIVGLLFSASMINYMDRATVSMALPSISSDLGLGPMAKGELLSAFFVSYEVGIWTGVQNFAGNIAGSVAPLTTGFLISWTGSYFPGFALAAVTLVAGLLAYWFIVGPLPHRQTCGSP